MNSMHRSSKVRPQQQERSIAARRAVRLAASVLIAFGLVLAACQRDNATGSANSTARTDQAAVGTAALPPASGAKQSSQGRYALGIVGYNYTEVGIDDYSVNGTGAFNLSVSNEDAGGGKTVCCYGWAPAAKLPMPVRIEWTRDEKTWCRRTVMLTDPGPPEPTTFEVHIYPDRHIEVAVTDVYSPPRMKLARAGAGYRVGKNLQKENLEAQRLDALSAECRSSRFPIGE